MRRTIELPDGFPTIVTLCGSTRFKDEYVEAARQETLKGNIVISVGLFGHQEGLDMEGSTKAMLDRLHKRKIDLADEILVLDCLLPYCNYCGKRCESWSVLRESACCGGIVEDRPYIGSSTRSEIEYAKTLNRFIRIRYWSQEQGISPSV